MNILVKILPIITIGFLAQSCLDASEKHYEERERSSATDNSKKTGDVGGRTTGDTSEGLALWEDKCVACHQDGKPGASLTAIQDAIDDEPQMKNIDLSKAKLQAIVDYLADSNDDDDDDDTGSSSKAFDAGKKIWVAGDCASCHKASEVLGEKKKSSEIVTAFKEAVVNQEKMEKFEGEYSATNLKNLAAYILEAGGDSSDADEDDDADEDEDEDEDATPALDGKTLAEASCASAGCHIDNLAVKTKASEALTISSTQAAIDGGIPDMAGVNVSDAEMEAIAEYMSTL